jgi:hypothetical protein
LPDTKNKQAYKMGTRINNAIRDNTPGPGNYDPNVNVVKDSTRQVKISQAANKSVLNHSKSTYEMPGPGSYYDGG